jgi:hypothetical protein
MKTSATIYAFVSLSVINVFKQAHTPKSGTAAKRLMRRGDVMMMLTRMAALFKGLLAET